MGVLADPAATNLPWLRPPLVNEPPPTPPPAPGVPAPAAGNMTLRPPPAPGETVEDVTPGSTSPRAFQISDPAGDPDHLADHLLVVYNARDLDSRALAYYYAQRRGIPGERVMAITCSRDEEISRAEFDETIRRPILSYIFQHGWMERQAETVQFRGQAITLLSATRNDIWSIVLMRGVPLKIESSSDYHSVMQDNPRLGSNAAAVDSELALLPVFGLPLGGFVPNPLYDSANSGELRVGPELATRMILVTRLDGPTPGCVRRMIDDTLQAESHRLAGQAVIDSRGLTDVTSGYTAGDMWLREARNLLAEDGWTVTFDDKPATLPATDPVNHVALYLGWYVTNADGPWVTPPDRFVPGAIAYHLHSYAAATLRSETKNWAGPLLEHGAAATMGAVYEPFLLLTPHLDIFTRRLLDGDSFAEAAYAAQPGLSWMITVVGDPLYRPFQLPIEEALAAAGPEPSVSRDYLLTQQLQRQLIDHAAPSAAQLQAVLDGPGTGAIAHERLGDLLQDLNDPAQVEEIQDAYRKALRLSVEPVDSIRIGLDLAQYEVSQNQDARAEAELKSLRDLYPVDAPRFGVSEELVPTGSR
jgi:uncharacterized protein (TIGR03790 family)